MNRRRFEDLILELVDENPFAVRPLLQVCATEYTDQVSTLAVTRAERPTLLVNLAFVAEHCRTDEEVKAVICHELLHVVLQHTGQLTELTPARHLACDAVINAIIHRSFGKTWSAMMSRYYGKETGLQKLLRPMTEEEKKALPWNYRGPAFRALPAWVRAWHALYQGSLVADDIADLAETLSRSGCRGGVGSNPSPFTLESGLPDDLRTRLLGDHTGEGAPEELSDALEEAVTSAMRQMNGDGIWRNPGAAGAGRAADPYQALLAEQTSEALKRWRRTARELLRRHVTPDRRSRAVDHTPFTSVLPVLSTGDRRAFLRARWSPFLPEASWQLDRPRLVGTTQIYLDVSGSMRAEMPELIALLGSLSKHIRRPFWAFSDEVAPAIIEGGILKAATTGGTSMACVLEHIATTRPTAAVVITDGYIERLPSGLVKKAAGTRLHVLISRDGNPSALRRIGLPYTQLSEVPR